MSISRLQKTNLKKDQICASCFKNLKIGETAYYERDNGSYIFYDIKCAMKLVKEELKKWYNTEKDECKKQLERAKQMNIPVIIKDYENMLKFRANYLRKLFEEMEALNG